MADVESYWWSDMTEAERSEWFQHAEPEVYLAAMDRQGLLIKCTDPATLTRVAQILTAPDADADNPAA